MPSGALLPFFFWEGSPVTFELVPRPQGGLLPFSISFLFAGGGGGRAATQNRFSASSFEVNQIKIFGCFVFLKLPVDLADGKLWLGGFPKNNQSARGTAEASHMNPTPIPNDVLGGSSEACFVEKKVHAAACDPCGNCTFRHTGSNIL